MAKPFFSLLLVQLCLCQDGFFLPDDVAGGPTSCLLPTGVPAFCTPTKSCRHINELIGNLQKPLPGDVALLIRDSFFCKTAAGAATEVCCPIDGIVPPPSAKPILPQRSTCGLQDDKFAAECTLYTNCSPFVQLLINLRRPFPLEIPQLIQSGFLCGTESSGGVVQPQVCCPKDAVVAPAATPPPPPVNRLESHPNRHLIPTLDKCGNVANALERIVGGQNATLGQYPWLANIGYSSGAPGEEVSFRCGGTLISPSYVITAAHCVTNLPGDFKVVKIRLGEYDLTKDPDCKPGGGSQAPQECSFKQDHDIAKIMHHENYSTPNPFQNDIALIRLDKPADLGEYVIPICLPFNDDEKETYFQPGRPKFLTEVAGWGATNERGKNPANVLQYLDVNVTDADACKTVYSTRGGILTPLQQMCAGGEKGKDSCVGDSGSALMREGEVNPSVWKIIGVVSFGPRLCGTEGIPGVYTRVRFYLEWVLNHIEA